MEQDLIDIYMQQVREHLEPLPEGQRERAIREIVLNINTSRSIGRTAEAIIERLGPPEAVAAQYVGRYGNAPSHASRARRKVWQGASLVAWAAGVIVVPLLGLVALALALGALVVPMYGVLHLFSPGWIVMGYAGWEVPREWSLPVAAVVGVLLGAGAWLIYAGLRLYVRWTAQGYEQHVEAPARQTTTQQAA